MNRRRVAWLSLVVVLLVLGMWAGPGLWRLVAFRRWAELHQLHYGPIQYTLYEFPRFSGYGRCTLSFSFHPREGWGVRHSLYSEIGYVETHYKGDGTIEFQSCGQHPTSALYESQEIGVFEPPWPYPVPYTPAQVRQLIHDAKLYVQEAAQRGEVQLPDGWEPVQ